MSGLHWRGFPVSVSMYRVAWRGVVRVEIRFSKIQAMENTM
jgi:hypothetical protein